MSDPSSVLLIGGDLNAIARADAASAAAGMPIRHVDPRDLEPGVAEGASVVLVDLDATGPGVLAVLSEAVAAGTLSAGRVIAFYSHVDEAAGTAARAAGFRALPRGRFWRELPALISGGEV